MATVTVLDIGTSKTICLVAENDSNGHIRVLAVGTAPTQGVKKGAVVDAHQVAESVSSAVKQVEAKLGGDVDGLHITLHGGQLAGSTGQGLVPIHPRGRAITREDVLQVLNHSRQLPVPSGKELLHAMPKEFLVDSQPGIHSAIGMPGSRLEVVTYVLTADATAVETAHQTVALAGKQADELVASTLASGMGALSPQDIELGCACIDIGAGKTDVAVFSSGSLIFSATIPIGGSLVTSDISYLVKTSLETAEELKLASGCALARTVPEQESVEVLQLGQVQARPMQRRVLCEIIESRMREIASQVKSAIETSQPGLRLPNGYVVTGGGSLLPGVVDLFEDTFGKGAVRLGRPDSVLPPMSATAPPAAAFAAAVGVAKFALDADDDDLAPASGADWMAKMKSLWSMFGAKS